MASEGTFDSVRVQCPYCSHGHVVAPGNLGIEIRCAKCGRSFQIGKGLSKGQREHEVVGDVLGNGVSADDATHKSKMAGPDSHIVGHITGVASIALFLAFGGTAVTCIWIFLGTIAKHGNRYPGEVGYVLAGGIAALLISASCGRLAMGYANDKAVLRVPVGLLGGLMSLTVGLSGVLFLIWAGFGDGGAFRAPLVILPILCVSGLFLGVALGCFFYALWGSK